MKKLTGLFFGVALGLAACNHKQPSQAQAESGQAQINSQGSLTGEPAGAVVYPRAKLVALPVENSASTVTASTAEPVTTAPVVAHGAPAPVTDSVIPDTATGAPLLTNAAPGFADSGNAAPAVTAAGNAASADAGMTTNTTATAIPLADAPTPPPLEISNDSVQVVVLQTTFGHIVIQLDDFAAPKTCANFRSLVSTGFYNGTIFHRVIPHFVIQGGDPNTKTDNHTTYGQGDPGYTLPPEIKLSHDRGAVAMARLPDTVNPQRDSNGSQFYICAEACPSLDDQYTVFGHVIQGMDVVERIANVPRDNRDDPLIRIALDARLEPKSQAIAESPAISH